MSLDTMFLFSVSHQCRSHKQEVVVSMLDSAISMKDTTLDIVISSIDIQKLQKKDDFCKYIFNMLNKNHLQSRHR